MDDIVSLDKELGEIMKDYELEVSTLGFKSIVFLNNGEEVRI